VFDGDLKVGDKIRMMGTGRTFLVTELGKMTPQARQGEGSARARPATSSPASRRSSDVRVGDTITLDNDPAPEPLPGYEPPRRWSSATSTPPRRGGRASARTSRTARGHREAALNDASFTFEPVHSEALGFGFRCGFLGLLHMDIIQERLEREGGVDVVPDRAHRLVPDRAHRHDDR
jgi:GTP-binding protein LepA